jgi:hypothetical protein
MGAKRIGKPPFKRAGEMDPNKHCHTPSERVAAPEARNARRTIVPPYIYIVPKVENLS